MALAAIIRTAHSSTCENFIWQELLDRLQGVGGKDRTRASTHQQGHAQELLLAVQLFSLSLTFTSLETFVITEPALGSGSNGFNLSNISAISISRVAFTR